tara:strand:+ start:914 stop:1255 length:342 start_codon:yes stop_codon:yes gene_type:complete
MEEDFREIGGNKFKLWVGSKLSKIGNKLVKQGEKVVISNPTCRLYNPYLLGVNFTVNGTEKYTLSVQGDYKLKYKQLSALTTKDGEILNPIPAEEMFMVILDDSNRKKWFLKS